MADDAEDDLLGDPMAVRSCSKSTEAAVQHQAPKPTQELKKPIVQQTKADNQTAVPKTDATSEDGAKSIDKPAAASSTPAHAHSQMREDDSGIGEPQPKASSARPMTQSEMEEAASEEAQTIRERVERALERTEEDRRKQKGQPVLCGIPFPSGIKKMTGYVLVVLAAGLSLFLVAQLAAVYADLHALPSPWNWLALAIAAVSACIFAFVIVRLLTAFVSLRRTTQLQLAGLRELAERGHLQAVAAKKLDEGQQKILAYVDAFPVNEVEKLRSSGFKEDEISELQKARGNLIAEDRLDAGQWIDRFQDIFQRVLDDAATRRVNAHAIKAGAASAACPNQVLDNAIVLFLSLNMLNELMRIYNLRTSSSAAALLLSQAVAHAFIGGEMQELTEDFMDSLFSAVADDPGALLSAVGSKLAGKATEGIANALLVRRLGNAARELLAPVIE